MNDSVKIVDEIARKSDELSMQQNLLDKSKKLQNLTTEYHPVMIDKLPRLKLYAELHAKISEALISGHITTVHEYITSEKFNDELELIHAKYLIKVAEIIPAYVSDIVKQTERLTI